jgi:cytochrome c551/c552
MPFGLLLIGSYLVELKEVRTNQKGGAKMRTLNEAIEHVKEGVVFCKDQASKHDLNDPIEKDIAREYRKSAKEYEQLAKWLEQLQKVQGIVKEYIYTPTEVMDCYDAFYMIYEVVGEKE